VAPTVQAPEEDQGGLVRGGLLHLHHVAHRGHRRPRSGRRLRVVRVVRCDVEARRDVPQPGARVRVFAGFLGVAYLVGWEKRQRPRQRQIGINEGYAHTHVVVYRNECMYRTHAFMVALTAYRDSGAISTDLNVVPAVIPHLVDPVGPMQVARFPRFGLVVDREHTPGLQLLPGNFNLPELPNPHEHVALLGLQPLLCVRVCTNMSASVYHEQGTQRL